MTGLKIQVPGTFTDTSLPIVFDDSVMSAGSLLLVDAQHSLGGFGAAGAVPANGGVCPNVAWQQAKAIVGSGDTTTLAPTWAKTTLGATSVLAERTTKKGLHVIVSQTAHVSGQGMRLTLPTLLAEYIRTHSTNSLYVSVWHRVTRAATNTDANMRSLFLGDAAALGTSYRQQFWHTSVATYGQSYPGHGQGTAQSIGIRDAAAADDGTGAKMLSSATSAYTGTTPGTLSADVQIFGQTGVNATAGNLQKHPSRIFYRLYIEDLTVSGRTYATVDALDYARYTTDMLTAGGRFYGDTFTAPSTLA